MMGLWVKTGAGLGRGNNFLSSCFAAFRSSCAPLECGCGLLSRVSWSADVPLMISAAFSSASTPDVDVSNSSKLTICGREKASSMMAFCCCAEVARSSSVGAFTIFSASRSKYTI